MEDKNYCYFSHDADAHDDPKHLQLLLKYEWRGYGIYWRICEALRTQKEYKFQFKNLNALAHVMHLEETFLREFIQDCIEKFTDNGEGLFKYDEDCFWSESLISRMNALETAKLERIEKARHAAEIRELRRLQLIENKTSQENLETISRSSQDDLTLSNKQKETKINKKKENIESSPFFDQSKQLTEFFKGMLKENQPIIYGRSQQKYEKSWLNCFEAMLRIDKRPMEEIKKVIEYTVVKGRSWWANTQNVQSPVKFRNRDVNGIFYYDRFLSEMDNGSVRNRGSPQPVRSGQAKPVGAR